MKRQGWYTVKEAAEELRFPSDKACRSWLMRKGVGNKKRGRIILVSSVDLDAAINPVTQRTTPLRLVSR